jgi:hypothetical protein
MCVIRWLTGIVPGIWTCFLLGCQVGPGTVRHERPDYNDAVLKTNEQQTFINMVRTYNHEDPLFMDLTEVDVVPTTTGTLTGGLSPAGGPTQTGNVAGSVGYSQQTTIRMAPILGQAEVTQLATPLTLESVANVVHSGYSLGTVLDLACEKVAKKWSDRDTAVKILNTLWAHGGVNVGTAKLPTPKQQTATLQQNGQQSTSPPDGLLIVVIRSQLNGEDIDGWRKLQRIFYGSSDDSNNTIVLQSLVKEPIELDSGVPKVSTPLATVVETRSALGVLREGERTNCAIFFTTPDECKTERDAYDAVNKPGAAPYYYIGDKPKEHSVHYLLIVYSPTPPTEPTFVSYFDRNRGLYYYIAGDDELSKTTFSLIHLFIIIQSAPPTTTPLTPTIPIGGASH